MEGFRNPNFLMIQEELSPRIEEQRLQTQLGDRIQRSLLNENDFFQQRNAQFLYSNMPDLQQNNQLALNNYIIRNEHFQNLRQIFRSNRFSNEAFMQYRDFGPEDYEMLIQLDRNIKKQGLSKEKLSDQKEFRVKKHPKPQTVQILDLTENLWTFKVTKGDPLIKDKCSICLDTISYSQLARQLTCSHIFHKKCIDKWFKNNQTCPIDRNVL